MSELSNILTKHDLEELLKPRLDEENAQIEDVSTTLLTKPGDNAGSIILAVEVILKPGPRKLHLVAKMLPRAKELQEIFNCEVTVRKETDMYQLVRPAFERIQKENNVPEDKFLDVFPVCYGARISSKGDDVPVDESSVILQENLKVQGYECGERFNGLNLAHCKLVIDKLARFHAMSVAIKIKKPEEFKATILRTGTTVNVGPTDMNWAKPLETIPIYETMKEIINAALLKGIEAFADTNPKPPQEPFATLTHLDLWVNNIMFHYGGHSSKNNPVDMKFVDFQITRYDSPARDLLFFLYTSAELEVLTEHYDYLVRLYYDSFVECLQLLQCDTTPFTFLEFLREMKNSSVIEFWHLVFMIAGVSIAIEDHQHSTADTKFKPLNFKVGKTYSSRASKLISDFASRNWI